MQFPEMESSLTYVKLVSKRGRLENSVSERKKAELSYLEFEKARLDEIDKLALSLNDGIDIDTAKHRIFILIFSPPLILSGSLAEDSRVHHHIILGPLAPNINLDGRIWKLVNSGQWDVLKKLHRPTLLELCPEKFRSKLNLLWN